MLRASLTRCSADQCWTLKSRSISKFYVYNSPRATCSRNDLEFWSISNFSSCEKLTWSQYKGQLLRPTLISWMGLESWFSSLSQILWQLFTHQGNDSWYHLWVGEDSEPLSPGPSWDDSPARFVHHLLTQVAPHQRREIGSWRPQVQTERCWTCLCSCRRGFLEYISVLYFKGGVGFLAWTLLASNHSFHSS